MLQLQVVQADFGDCLILRYGSPNSPRFLLVDGGPTLVYENHLRSRLDQIAGQGGKLDRVVLSHVDTDHIVGLLSLFGDLLESDTAGQQRRIKVDGLWHNSFEKAIGGGTDLVPRLQAAMAAAAAAVRSEGSLALLGIGEGNRLRTLALQLQIPLNHGFNDDLICVDDAPATIEFDNLKVHVVGPTRQNLETLKQEWLEWLDENEPLIATADPQFLANADRSIPNLSSIMLLAEADGKTVLLTGDGRSDHLLDGLAAGNHLDHEGKLHVDVLKVMHHGSNRNVTKTFFKKVTADIYVISANGHPDNPDLSTLIWLVEAAEQQNRNPRIIFTNRTFAVDKLLQEYPEAEYGYAAEIMSPNVSDLILDLA
jgi:hypothetical protein